MNRARTSWFGTLRPGARRSLAILLLTAAYAVAAHLGLAMDALGGLATLVWPPTGIALAALLLFGLELWPGVALGALIANRWAGASWALCAIITLGNTLGALLGAYALTRASGFEHGLARLKSSVLLVLVAIAGTLISASIGVGGMALCGVLGKNDFATTWQVWWVGDLIGNLLIAPVFLSWSTRSRASSVWRPREALLLTLALVTALALVFGALTPAIRWSRQAYLLMPFLIWAAVRFGPRGASLANLLTCSGAIWGTVVGRGPFVRGTLHEGLLSLQTFMSLIAVTFLILAAVTAERSALLESERAARADAERAVRMRDEFLAVASHELRTPLTPLQLQLQSVQRAAQSGDPRLLERVDRALAQSARLARLIDGLLDVSRLAAGKLELVLDPCDLQEIAQDALELLREQAERAGSTLTLSSSGQLIGNWDRGRLEQLFSNLLSNAIKYGSGRPIEVTLGRATNRAEVTVRDHGIGIARDAQSRIFERFERAAPSREYDGLGLGLYVARQITLAHHGEIRVVSEPNAGSAFTVSLPIDPSSEPARD